MRIHDAAKQFEVIDTPVLQLSFHNAKFIGLPRVSNGNFSFVDNYNDASFKCPVYNEASGEARKKVLGEDGLAFE